MLDTLTTEIEAVADAMRAGATHADVMDDEGWIHTSVTSRLLNALPALLRVARAALEVETAREARRNAYEMGVILRGSPGARESALAREDAMSKTDARLGRAEVEYRAAVAALDALEAAE